MRVMAWLVTSVLGLSFFLGFPSSFGLLQATAVSVGPESPEIRLFFLLVFYARVVMLEVMILVSLLIRIVVK